MLMCKIASLFQNVKTINLFCDSQIVLSWLKSIPIKLPAYKGVYGISNLTQSMHWHYIPSLLNPADILSRGSISQELIKNILWWHGPDYLFKTSEYNFDLSNVEFPLPSLSEHSECTVNYNSVVIKDCTNEFAPFFTDFNLEEEILRPKY